MKSSIPLFLFLSTLTSVARAAEPSIGQIIAHCESQYGASNHAAVAQCVTDIRFSLAEERDKAIVDELDAGRDRDEQILAEVRQLSVRVDQLVTQPVPAPQTPTAAPAQTVYGPQGGGNYRVVTEPIVVSIHNIEGMVTDSLHITDLASDASRKRCGGVGAPFVVFLDHGVPVTNVFAPQGAPTGFREVYWDRAGDGTPDGSVLALDLGSQTDVWITWAIQNDLEVRYLRPGQKVAVAGFGLQTVYHPTQKSENPGSGVVGCDMSPHEPRGGHLTVPAHGMSRVW